MIFLIILGMALVTMIPRIIPAFIVDHLIFKDWVNRFLNAIPYAALGALIFPAILYVIPDKPIIGLVGGVIAILLSLMNLNIILIVIGAILTVFILSQINWL
ncbi:AzlD domain-containing protein [Cerasibacillus terrae]|uniref:AzlD domain-containing protein n=1 Tax=Cerasibacillus terrae TaxID=2498845 RepID=A0A5C8NRJ8_9BACI|nr:AzlD domain-containing protein [Cerasibacillus terrae]TXL63972.1 AzlD domain-containing protein [Cerasibacillus terrae]